MLRTLLLCLLFSTSALAQDSTITYQGQLRQAGEPFTGLVHLEFRLFDAASGGAQVGDPQSRANWPVEDGLFQVELDFGPAAFGADARYLEIRVDGLPLSPRQAIRASPLALFALAGNAGPPGPIGPQGPAGPAGQDGQDGTSPFVLEAATGAIEYRFNDQLFRFTPDANASLSPRIVLGHAGNQSLAAGATVSGGGSGQLPNQARGEGSTVGGGLGNTVLGLAGTVAGGERNTAGTESTVAGGTFNEASGTTSAIGGGSGNDATAALASVGGGLANSATGLRSRVGGGGFNLASGEGAVVAGGGGAQSTDGLANIASGAFSAIAGGQGHRASGFAASVGGGSGNEAIADLAAIGGGRQNAAAGDRSTVGGGDRNVANGLASTVVGGFQNSASGEASTAGGGALNCAGAGYSWAGGRRAKVRPGTGSGVQGPGGCQGVPTNGVAGDFGTFVWADSQSADFVSTGLNQFLVRANGGVGINTNAPETQLHVLGPSPTDDPFGQLRLEGSETSGAAGTGAGLSFLGHDGSIRRIWGYIQAVKENATVGNSRSRMSFHTRGASGLPVERLRIDSNGTTFNSTGSWSTLSDGRLKTDIGPIPDALERLGQLRGVRFRYSEPETAMGADAPRMGFLAEEVEQVFPEWVGYRDDGYRFLTLTGFEAVVVEALRSLQQRSAQALDQRDAQIASLQAGLARVESENRALREALATLEQKSGSSALQAARQAELEARLAALEKNLPPPRALTEAP